MNIAYTSPLRPLSILIFACAQLAQSANANGITVATDTNCVVELDGKIVTRVGHLIPVLVPAKAGSHKLSAATLAGDYFETTIEVNGEASTQIAISFADVRAQRAASVKKVEAIKEQVDLIRLALDRRRRIVEAVNYYADRWGKESGLLEEREQNVQNAKDAQESLVMQNAGNIGDTNATAANGYMMMGAWIYERYQKKKAHRHDLAASFARERMDYLRKALEDPVKFPPEDEKGDYLAIVRDVKRGKATGKLSLAPNGLQYADAETSVRLSCSDLRGASGGSGLSIKYKTGNSIKSLSVQPIKKAEGSLVGTLYVACPALTQ